MADGDRIEGDPDFGSNNNSSSNNNHVNGMGNTHQQQQQWPVAPPPHATASVTTSGGSSATSANSSFVDATVTASGGSSRLFAAEGRLASSSSPSFPPSNSNNNNNLRMASASSASSLLSVSSVASMQAHLRQQATSGSSSLNNSTSAAAATTGSLANNTAAAFNNNNHIARRGSGSSNFYTGSSVGAVSSSFSRGARRDEVDYDYNIISSNNNNGMGQDLVHIPERDMEESLNPNTTITGWAEVELAQEPGAVPSARSLHAAALLNGNLLVFGGYDGTQRVNTFFAFNFQEKRWSPVLPSCNSGPPPSPRDRHVAVAYGNSFYVHAGFDGERRVADFWAFDFSTMAWREVVASQGRPPSPRHSHVAVVHGHSMYVFAGYDGSYKSDLHQFDFTLSRWGAVPAVGRRPRARYRATCVVHRSYLIVYGGHDGTRHLSDTHAFDLETQTWSSLVTEGTPPIPRDSHISIVHGNSMYVFGGSSGSAMNDLHELQLPPTPSSPARWRPVNTSRSEQPRHRFCHVAVVYCDSMYVFGGYDGSDRLNDFIRFDFAVYDLSFEVPPSTIISDFRSLINDSRLSDVTFMVEDQPVYAHKLMLMRSSYFEALFMGQMREATMDTISIEEVRYPTFLKVLEYLYTDQLRIPLNAAMEVFEAADLFCIPRLKTMCEKRMLESITVENAASIFHAADMHSAMALRQKAKKYILSHFENVSKSASFEEMGRQNIELVFELLRSR